MPSIKAKLERFKTMQLSQMQDLGGCRAIVEDAGTVAKLVSVYESAPMQTAKFCEKYDYVTQPKQDGYRGVHLVYEYRSQSEERSIYNGMRIEVQVRSKMQHSWATAVEVIDVFTNQALKSGMGETKWRRFFLLASMFISMVEKTRTVREIRKAAHDQARLLSEFRSLCRELNVIDTLAGIGAGLKIAKVVRASVAYILVLDLQNRNVQVLGFDSEEEASRAYIELEKNTLSNPALQAVMVSVDSVKALRRACPNYFLDTRDLITIIGGVDWAFEHFKTTL